MLGCENYARSALREEYSSFNIFITRLFRKIQSCDCTFHYYSSSQNSTRKIHNLHFMASVLVKNFPNDLETATKLHMTQSTQNNSLSLTISSSHSITILPNNTLPSHHFSNPTHPLFTPKIISRPPHIIINPHSVTCTLASLSRGAKAAILNDDVTKCARLSRIADE